MLAPEYLDQMQRNDMTHPIQRTRPTLSSARLARCGYSSAPAHTAQSRNTTATRPCRYERPSADTAAIVHAALDGLKGIYREGFKYAKAGVMLLDLQPDHQQQGELDLDGDRGEDSPRLMTAPDGLNQRYGKGTVLMGSPGLDGDRRARSMKQERRTPGYTTRWTDGLFNQTSRSMAPLIGHRPR